MRRIAHIVFDNKEHVIRHNGDLLYAVTVEVQGMAARNVDKQNIVVLMPDGTTVTVTIKSDRRSPRRK